jgi:hypothetical protein
MSESLMMSSNVVIRNGPIFGECRAVQAASQNLVVYSAVASQIVTLAWFVFPFIVVTIHHDPEKLVGRHTVAPKSNPQALRTGYVLGHFIGRVSVRLSLLLVSIFPPRSSKRCREMSRCSVMTSPQPAVSLVSSTVLLTQISNTHNIYQ